MKCTSCEVAKDYVELHDLQQILDLLLLRSKQKISTKWSSNGSLVSDATREAAVLKVKATEGKVI